LPGASDSGISARRPRRSKAGLWSLPFLVALTVSFVLAAISYDSARRNDEAFAADQRTRLLSLLSDNRDRLGRPGALDGTAINDIARHAGIDDLSFSGEPLAGRESQPLLDVSGRIVGFFSWTRPQPAVGALQPVLPPLGAFVLLLAGLASVLAWRLRSVRRRLAAARQEAARAAETDKLTGLANHAGMVAHLERALASRSAEDTVSFALIAVDGLADAHLGALGNDELIAEVARRLTDALPESALCGRVASSEFAVVLTTGGDLEAETMLRAALDAIGKPYWIGTAVRLNAHLGFARAPQHGVMRAALARRAEVALRAAGKKGPGTLVVFVPELDETSAEQAFIQRELGRALTANALDVHFQPIVAGSTGAVVGVEALARWTHPERGPIPPATFIPVAEQMGLMDALGAFVLRRALQEAKRWPDVYVAVNLSPLQVRNSGIVDLVTRCLAETGVPASRLMLEITEGVLVDNPDEMVRRIEDLHAVGVRVALDDFGAGYSNLGYLQRFPLDKIKIDKSFVDALGTSGNGGVILQAMVALGRALGLSITVEGVETEQQRVLLRLAGCDEMQGYLFAKPAPAQSIDRMLKRATAVETPRALTA
jgi:diguanylate cyclase (GGDEF)-like protein